MKSKVNVLGAMFIFCTLQCLSPEFTRIKAKLSPFIAYQAALQKSCMLFGKFEEEVQQGSSINSLITTFYPQMHQSITEIGQKLAACSEHFSVKTRHNLEDCIGRFRLTCGTMNIE